jgi:hypothetical protein
MANFSRNFTSGRMNKAFDERVIPNGEYIDALNCRLGSTEDSDIGSLENSKGNIKLTTLQYIDGTPLSANARTIGAYEDGANETIYWFVHDPTFTLGATGKLDMIVSYNVQTTVLTYHVVSIDDGSTIDTTLNFNPLYLITGVNLVDSNSEGLLFWTDDYNQPRFINISRNYNTPVAFIDQFSAESLLVIKKPPIEAPTISFLTSSNQENFLEERFICFAYRYKYADNEYSATSQFSEPAFIPKPFSFEVNSFLNEGMVNIYNTVQISFNTGGPLVVGIDLLFKEAANNTIKVIEKLDKAILGWGNNTIQNYTFNNSKIFTVLPEAELLRLYDNVPRLAKAQTIMGNRLVYGNYVEGYDLIDKFDNPLTLTYYTDLQTEIISNSELTDTTDDANYSWSSIETIPNSRIVVDFTSVANSLNSGAQITIEVDLEHNKFTGSSPDPLQQTVSAQFNWTFTLPTNYASVSAMATSVQFQDAVGTVANIKPVYDPINPTSCSGFTFTDLFNCSIPNVLSLGFFTPLGSTFVSKYQSGSTGPGQPILIFPNYGGDPNKVGFQFPVMRFVEDPTGTIAPIPLQYGVYEYYQVLNAKADFTDVGAMKSLHSNRGYDVGIVYMDEFNRASTALVSENNTVHVPCGYCDKRNWIKVTIPISQRAPYWAKRYKFVIKADRENYETIYASIFFIDPDTNNAYILLDGENARKVEAGDRLIVKSDSAGSAQNCQYVTVLEKEAKPDDFLQIPSILDPSTNIHVPGGVYMKVNPSNLSLIYDELSYITYNSISFTAIGNGSSVSTYPAVYYPVRRYDTVSSTWVDYDIPAGSRIMFDFEFERKGTGDGNNNCEKRYYKLTKTLISSADYINFKAWFDGDNVQNILNDGFQDVGGSGCAIGNVYNSTLLSGSIPNNNGDELLSPPGDLCNNQYQFIEDPATQKLALRIIGTKSCGYSIYNKKIWSSLKVNIQVFRADDLLIFETEPSDTLPDVFYENNMSFGVGPNGEHLGNIQDQDFATNTSGIVDTQFFNCFAYGNGAESYKVRDSVVGRTFNLGNRITTVAAQDYKEADRFADLTYSGVYNDESNVNRLNAFNMGLLNFKALEDSFGPITLIDARETDILVLQEDKISYVLAGKNLLSDAAAGGAITSVPEVLGTQIARIEKYGNSFNPESFAKWGAEKYFTDAKRGSVIMLQGDSYNNERLSVISEANMRPWFRDVFIDTLGKQKLGGYDPYMTEYVLSTNNIPIPTPSDCIDCGFKQTFTILGPENPKIYCVDLGILVGDFVVNWEITSLTPGDTVSVDATYDGVTTSSGAVVSGGSFTITKGGISPTTVDMDISSTGLASVKITVSCPEVTEITIIEVVLTDDVDSGKYIHAEYKYVNGPYISPITSNLVTFQSSMTVPLVSRYNSSTGAQGFGSFPLNGSIVTLISNKIGFDDFDFNPATNNFRWLRSNTLYNNTSVDINALLAAANVAAPIMGSAPTYYADFVMPTSTDQYLYLIWDLRSPVETVLCYDELSLISACCGCGECLELCSYYELTNSTEGANVQYTDCYSGETFIVSVPLGVSYLCSSTLPVPIRGAEVDVVFSECGCPSIT